MSTVIHSTFSPVYEFICEECGETFEELVSSSGKTLEITCPYCHSDLVRKLISTFSEKHSESSPFVETYRFNPTCNTRST